MSDSPWDQDNPTCETSTGTGHPRLLLSATTLVIAVTVCFLSYNVLQLAKTLDDHFRRIQKLEWAVEDHMAPRRMGRVLPAEPRFDPDARPDAERPIIGQGWIFKGGRDR